ncbi:MAG TPA: hypothetical protein VFZ09_27610 [Archangium sp.]|uniref:hypothetical protein n=1 Tax=Archangium sp. TaxID=1872627 RepID=UPI002E30D237|nr:hypothetical protein [Archangium sp.]HEX5750028.1 hypothetical protein [Archangium sp.]
MRPLTEQLIRILTHPAGYHARGRVRILGPDGQWWDLTNLLGRDFLEGVDVDENLDMPVGQATVRLMRQVRGLSLAPLMTSSLANNLAGSYAPLVDPNRRFRVEVAVGVRGQPVLPVWLPLFFGRIDSVDSGNPDIITFTGRDLSSALQDVWTDEEKVYGSDGGVPLETVCNAILTDAQLSDFALYTPVASAQALGKYKQDYEPCMDALSKLAVGRGWEVRWKLRPDTGDWGLWLWGPDRTATAPVWTYTASDYQYLGELRMGLEDVRTAVEVVYPDASDLDAAGQPKRKTVRRESATALARFGWLTSGGTRLHRLMRVTEGASTNLRTAAEAGRLADLALADLSTMDAGATVEVGFHPALELADLVALTPNGVNFNAEQRLAVRQVTHSLSSTSAKTTLRLLGKPSLGPAAWLSMESRAGIAPGAPFTGPAAPSGLGVTNSVTGAVLSFTAPNITSGGPRAEEYELHVYDTPGAALSSATRREVSNSTCFDVTGLTAGATKYARVRSRDRKGNVGPASEEVTLAPRYVTPSDVAQNVTWSALPLNSDLESHPDPSSPPAAWRLVGGTWGVDAVAETSTVFSGSRSVRLQGTGTPTLESQRFTVRPGDRLTPSAVVLVPAPENLSHTAALWLFWYDAAGSTVGSVKVSETYSAGSDVWQILGVRARPTTVPLAARYASVGVSKSGTSSYFVYVDSVRVVLLADTFLYRYPLAASGVGWVPPSGKVAPRYRMNSLGEIRLEGCVNTGTLGEVAFYLDAGDRPAFTADYMCAGELGPATIRIAASTGAVTPIRGSFPINIDGVTFLAQAAGTL